MPLSSAESPAKVSVARFMDREEAGAFCAIAAECGVATRVVDSRRASHGFDGTLGGADQVMGYLVRAKIEDVPALRAHLESSMEIDPLDPLLTAGGAELRAIAEGPLEGNLCEQIIAARILASRPPEITPEPAHLPLADTHLAGDRRVARWLGVTGLGFTAICLTIFLNGILLVATPHSRYEYRSFSMKIGMAMNHSHDPIADNLRPFLLILVPMGTGAALILSQRQLRNGTTRRMFPGNWQLTGYFLFWLPAAVLAAILGAAALISAR